MTRLTLPARALDRLARASEIPASLCPPLGGYDDGAVVELHAIRGGVVGLAVVDHEAAAVRVYRRDGAPGDSLDHAWAEQRLATAAELRTRLGLAGDDRAYRLVNGAGDGVPGVLVDVYAGWGVVAASTAACVPTATLVSEALVARGTARGAIVKRRGRGQAARGPAIVAAAGEPLPERIVVAEPPWRFEVHPATGVNVGLFTDMREERVRIARICRGRRVLNLFAYTGALSVAAAAGGASHVTSVDLSQGVLAWARDHFALNGLDPARHATVAEDVAAFLVDAAARDDRFDIVLIDPPSFSSARQAPFAIDRDYAPIVAAALDVLAPGGDLWLAANTRGFSLTGAAHHALTSRGRQGHVVWTGGLPPDYPTELADTDARYLQACLLRVV